MYCLQFEFNNLTIFPSQPQLPMKGEITNKCQGYFYFLKIENVSSLSSNVTRVINVPIRLCTPVYSHFFIIYIHLLKCLLLNILGIPLKLLYFSVHLLREFGLSINRMGVYDFYGDATPW